ncbi:hypothetical protein [Paenibacillus larvae]|uniref:hypothetical protein n=1 Tax=Paenibacillus larvae TaxID=1464 RepID=UPI002891CE61|nr:hypothetical protein [Paenibacillus larvae]MDT2193355.1 hypothetical protein [Paenibacillus larvae]
MKESVNLHTPVGRDDQYFEQPDQRSTVEVCTKSAMAKAVAGHEGYGKAGVLCAMGISVPVADGKRPKINIKSD